MPPLLPEYLSQPVQIFVQESGADWLAPSLSLAGVAIGATLTHFLGKKHERQRIKQEKLEDIFGLSSLLKEACQDYAHHFMTNSIDGSDAVNIKCRDPDERESRRLYDLIQKLDFLMKVHMPHEVKNKLNMVSSANSLYFEVAFKPLKGFEDENDLSDFIQDIHQRLEKINSAHRALADSAIKEAKSYFKATETNL